MAGIGTLPDHIKPTGFIAFSAIEDERVKKKGDGALDVLRVNANGKPATLRGSLQNDGFHIYHAAFIGEPGDTDYFDFQKFGTEKFDVTIKLNKDGAVDKKALQENKDLSKIAGLRIRDWGGTLNNAPSKQVQTKQKTSSDGVPQLGSGESTQLLNDPLYNPARPQWTNRHARHVGDFYEKMRLAMVNALENQKDPETIRRHSDIYRKQLDHFDQEFNARYQHHPDKRVAEMRAGLAVHHYLKSKEGYMHTQGSEEVAAWNNFAYEFRDPWTRKIANFVVDTKKWNKSEGLGDMLGSLRLEGLAGLLGGIAISSNVFKPESSMMGYAIHSLMGIGTAWAATAAVAYFTNDKENSRQFAAGQTPVKTTQNTQETSQGQTLQPEFANLLNGGLSSAKEANRDAPATVPSSPPATPMVAKPVGQAGRGGQPTVLS